MNNFIAFIADILSALIFRLGQLAQGPKCVTTTLRNGWDDQISMIVSGVCCMARCTFGHVAIDLGKG